jgi:hypothetical protein
MSTDLVSADISLNNCLPVPVSSVSIHDVLDFKERRKDELTALRQTLDELYLEIANSSDIPRSKIASIARLESAIKDITKVSKQSWGNFFLADRKVSLDINAGTISQGTAIGASVGITYSSPLIGVLAGVAQTLLSSVKFEISFNSQLKDATGRQIELSYLSAMISERIIK